MAIYTVQSEDIRAVTHFFFCNPVHWIWNETVFLTLQYGIGALSLGCLHLWYNKTAMTNTSDLDIDIFI